MMLVLDYVSVLVIEDILVLLLVEVSVLEL
jgi:hypothetical protein